MRGRLMATGLLVVLVSLFIAVLVALLSTPTVVWLDIGSPNDQKYIDSASISETNYLGTYRWAYDQTELRIPVPSSGTYRLEFGMFTIEPEGRSLHISCGDDSRSVPLADRAGYFTVSQSCTTETDQIVVKLEADPVRVEADGRPLGVALVSVNLQARNWVTLASYYLQVVITVFGTLAGLYFCANALGWRRARFILPGIAAYSWLVIAVFGQGLFVAGVAGPGGLLLLAGSMTTVALADGRRHAALLVASLTVPVVFLIPPPDLDLLLAAHWTERDAWATLLLPWVASASLILAALVGTKRAVWLAATGTLTGLLSLAIPAISRSLHFSVEIAVPDWKDTGSPGGVVYLAVVFGTTAVAYWVVRSRPERPVIGLLAVAAFAVISLIVWRVGVMNLNGDEPHYYVMARSVGIDQDLELLNNYHEPEYIEATISPDGNIAMSRDDDSDRYTGMAPGGEGTWYLAPPATDGWQTIPISATLLEATGEPPEVVAPDGTRERLMPLDAADDLTMVIPAGCKLDQIWLGIPDGQPRQVRLDALNPDGRITWSRDIVTSGELAAVDIGERDDVCVSDDVTSIRIRSSNGPVVAQTLNQFNGLQVIPARKVADFVILAGTPRDRYASRASGMRVGVYNPEETEILVTIRLMGSSNLTIRETVIGVPPGQSRAEMFPTSSVDAVLVSATGKFVAAGSATLLGHSYSLPLARSTNEWKVPVAATDDRDAGVWLSFVNPRSEPVIITVDANDDRQSFELCQYCADTVLIESEAHSQTAEVSSDGANGTWFGAVEYEERTESLHFDVGLPIISALPAALGPVWTVFSIPAFFALLMAPGMFILLRRTGSSDEIAVAGALLTVLLLPMSTYAVRLYTEPVAASILIWALVLWDVARRRAWLNIVVLAIAAILPLLHGRLTPLAVGLVMLVIVSLFHGWLARASIKRLAGYTGLLLGLVIVAVILITVVIRPFAVSLSVRASLDYFGFVWVPVNTAGMLLDRGSGLLPFAPWILLSLAAPRPLRSLQRGALFLIVINAVVIALRVGGWQTWGAPGRYLLPVVPLLMLFAVPGALRLWRTTKGRVAVAIIGGWSAFAAFMLHWIPLSGYTRDGIYLIDEAFLQMLGVSPWAIFPTITPRAASTWAGLLGLLLLVAIGVAVIWMFLPLVRGDSGSESSDAREPSVGSAQAGD